MNKNIQNFNTKITNYVIILVLYFHFLEFCKGDACPNGCIECQYDNLKQSSICYKCDVGFILDEQNICKSQQCDENLYLQIESIDSSSKCVAICEDYYQQDINSRVCKLLDQCPHSFITDTNFGNNQEIKNIIQYSKDMYLIIYDRLINFVNKQSGQILYKYFLPSSIINIYFVNGVLISLLSNQTVNIWKIEINQHSKLVKIQQGAVSTASQINSINNQFLCITSFDEQKKFVYFNLFKSEAVDNQNQYIQLSISNQKLYFISNVIAIQNEQGIKIVSIDSQINDQNFIFTDITSDFVCEKSSSQTIINLIHSKQNKKIVIQFQSFEELFVIDYQTTSCIKISNQQVNKLLIYQRLNKPELLITTLSQSIVIRSFTSLQIIIKQINFSNTIKDILLNEVLSQISFFVLLSSKEIQWFISDNLDDNSNYSQNKKIQVKIDNPSQLIPIYNSDSSLNSFFAVGFDYQYIDISQFQNINTKYIVQSFRQSYQANKGQTTKIYIDQQQNLVYQCSIDGMLTVWNVISSYRVEYYKEYQFKQDRCRDFVLLKSKIIAVVLSSQISVFDVTNPNQKQNFTLPSQSLINKYSLTCNQEYILIQLDDCIRLIDQSQTIILNKCISEFSLFTNSYISKDKYIYSFGATFIKSYQVDLQQYDLIQQSVIVNNAQNIQYYQVEESMNNKLFFIYFESNTKKLIILDETYSKIIEAQIATVDRIVDIKCLKDPDNQYRFFIVYISNVVSQSSKYIFHSIKQGEQATMFINQVLNSSGIIQVSFYFNSKGDLIYKIHTSSSLSYTCLVFGIKWNYNTKVSGVEQFTFNRDDSFSFLIQNQKYIQTYAGNTSGLIALSPNIINYSKKIYENDQQDSTDIMQIEQSYQLNRIFIIKKHIIEYDMFLNQKIENIKFDDEGGISTEDIKQFQINNNLRVVTCFKSFQLILKSYSQKQITTYSINNFGTINSYYLHEKQKVIYIYGTKLSSFDINLQNEYIIIQNQNSNKQIRQCIFPDNQIICKLGDFSLVFINNSDFTIQKQFEVSGIEQGFLISMDIQYQYLFLYKKSILIYSLQGVYLRSLLQPTQDIIELNLYGSKLVVVTIGSNIYNSYSFQNQQFFL